MAESCESTKEDDLSTKMAENLKISCSSGGKSSEEYKEDDFYARAKKYFKFEKLNNAEKRIHSLAVFDFFMSETPKASVECVAEGAILAFFNVLLDDNTSSAYEETEMRKNTTHAVAATRYEQWTKFCDLVKYDGECVDELVNIYKSWSTKMGDDRKNVEMLLGSTMCFNWQVEQILGKIVMILMCAVAKHDGFIMKRLTGMYELKIDNHPPKFIKNRVLSFCKFMSQNYKEPCALLFSCIDEMIDNRILTDSMIEIEYKSTVQLRARYYGMSSFGSVIKAARRLAKTPYQKHVPVEHELSNQSFNLFVKLNAKCSRDYPTCYARMLDLTLLEDLADEYHPALTFLFSCIDARLKNGDMKLKDVYMNQYVKLMPKEHIESLFGYAYDVFMKCTGEDLFRQSFGNPYLEAAIKKMVGDEDPDEYFRRQDEEARSPY